MLARRPRAFVRPAPPPWTELPAPMEARRSAKAPSGGSLPEANNECENANARVYSVCCPLRLSLDQSRSRLDNQQGACLRCSALARLLRSGGREELARRARVYSGGGALPPGLSYWTVQFLCAAPDLVLRKRFMPRLGGVNGVTGGVSGCKCDGCGCPDRSSSPSLFWPSVSPR